eukprot:5517843-Ditylum_brightwellii.AAC.1
MAVDITPSNYLRAVNAATEAAYGVFKGGGDEKDATVAAISTIRAFHTTPRNATAVEHQKKRFVEKKLAIQAT